MKKYHEIAAIKDGNTVVGFLIAENSHQNRIGYGEYNYIDYIDIQKMKELCYNNQMDYLVYNKEKDRLEVEYTQDDIKEMKHLGISTKMISRTSTLSEYIKSDIRIKKKYIDVLYSEYGNNILLGVTITCMKMPFVGKIVTLMVFGDVRLLDDFLGRAKSDPICASLYSSYKIYQDNAIISLPINKMDLLSNTDILIDTSSLDREKASKDTNKLSSKLLISALEVVGDTEYLQPLRDKTKLTANKYGLNL